VSFEYGRTAGLMMNQMPINALTTFCHTMDAHFPSAVHASRCPLTANYATIIPPVASMIPCAGSRNSARLANDPMAG
jgi:hypothetical protein